MDDKAYNVTEDANASMASHRRLVWRAFHVESCPPARSYRSGTICSLSRSVRWIWKACSTAEARDQDEAAMQVLYPVAICGTEFAARMRKKSEDYVRIIREVNIKLELPRAISQPMSVQAHERSF
jgi:hypothetical protein